MNSYRYYQGANGQRFCFATDPVFECPFSDGPPAWLCDAAVDVLDEDHFVRLWKKGHGNGYRERDEKGKLTDKCASCGMEMDRKGFRAWIEEPSTDESRLAIADRMGFDAMDTIAGSVRWFERKKDAREWALEESKVSQLVASEA